MNVDTADLTEVLSQLAALRDEVAGVSRKVSCLTGRVTVMGNHTDHGMSALVKLLIAVLGAGDDGHEARPVGKPAARRDRHGLHLVASGDTAGPPGRRDETAPAGLRTRTH